MVQPISSKIESGQERPLICGKSSPGKGASENLGEPQPKREENIGKRTKSTRITEELLEEFLAKTTRENLQRGEKIPLAQNLPMGERPNAMDEKIPMENQATSSSGVTSACGPGIYALQEGESLAEHHAQIRMIAKERKALVIPMITIFSDGLRLQLKVLIETGCEMNLVRPGIFPEKNFSCGETSSFACGGKRWFTTEWI